MRITAAQAIPLRGRIEDIVTGPFQLDRDGMLPIPTAPGLGIGFPLDEFQES
jgi:L-alanine-DL-glutamate epimerase-like enolase superfamily enzyme